MRNRLISLLLAMLLIAVPAEVFAAEQNGLQSVTFHTDYVDEIGAKTMQQGVAELWNVIEPYAEKHGLTEFPRMDIWGFGTKQQAIDHTGRRAFWENFGGGYANPRQAYVLLENNRDSGIVAHEATHVLQYALSGANLGHDCIAEGAAVWYSTRVRERLGGPSLDQILELRRPQPIDPVHQEILENSGIEVPDNRWDSDIPAFSNVVTRAQFEQVKSHNHRIYSMCMFAFDLLINTGGGEEAYFDYLVEVRTSGWRTAFDRAFKEDLNTFENRFAVYRESGFREYKFEHEIRNEEILQKILECDSLGGRNICVE